MLPQNHPDRIQIAFDDHRLVNNVGLLLPATLALHLGLPQLVQKHLGLGDAPGRANTGDKLMTLVVSALAGGDCIDDADLLRAGGHPPWPGRRSRRWWNPGRWSAARRRVRTRQPRHGPATPGSLGPVGGRGPTGSCAGRFPEWREP